MISGQILIVIALIAQIPDVDAGWQRLSRISPGQDVDVYLTTNPMLRGRLANFSAQGFSVTDGFHSIAVDRSTVRKVTRKSRFRGGLFGFAVGAAVGAALSIPTVATSDRNRGTTFGGATLAGGFWGAVIGTSIGRQAAIYKVP